MGHIDAVCNQESVGVVALLGLVEPGGRNHDHVGLLHEFLLHPANRGLVGAGELRKLVHAVIDEQALTQGAGHIGRAGHEGPGDGFMKTELAAGAAQAPCQKPAVHPSGRAVAVKGNYQRCEDGDVLRHGAASPQKLPQFLPCPPKVPDRSRGVAVAGGVDPQHAVLLGEPQGDVLLAQGFGVPVVGEADDVISFYHGGLPQPASCSSKRGWPDGAAARPGRSSMKCRCQNSNTSRVQISWERSAPPCSCSRTSRAVSWRST